MAEVAESGAVEPQARHVVYCGGEYPRGALGLLWKLCSVGTFQAGVQFTIADGIDLRQFAHFPQRYDCIQARIARSQSQVGKIRTTN